ncbi:MAG: hypothetical protein ABEJ83_01090 [Candidatus Nanohaloarchaea archaeon]
MGIRGNGLRDKQGYSRLIFLSCIDKPRNKMEITREWGLSESSKPLHRKSVNDEIELLRADMVLETKDSKLHSSLSDPKKGFPEYLDSQLKDNNLDLLNSNIDLVSPLSDHTVVFGRLLGQEWFRKSVLDIDNIKNYFGYESSEWEKIGVDIVRHNFNQIFIDIYLEIILLEIKNKSKVIDSQSATKTPFATELADMMEAVITSYRSIGSTNPEVFREAIRSEIVDHRYEGVYEEFYNEILVEAVPFLDLETDWEEEVRRLNSSTDQEEKEVGSLHSSQVREAQKFNNEDIGVDWDSVKTLYENKVENGEMTKEELFDMIDNMPDLAKEDKEEFKSRLEDIQRKET